MEPAVAACALLGAVAGVAAGVLPGLHVNGMAAALLALAPAAGAPGVAFLVCALAASPFGLALSATFLGGAEEDALPAEVLAREGRGAEACALLAWGAFAGLALALPLALLLRGLLVPLGPLLARGMPWLLLAIVAVLVLTETRRLPLRRAWLVAPWGEREAAGPLRRHPRRRARLRVGPLRVRDPHGLLHDAPEGEETRVRVARGWAAPTRWGGRLAALGVLVLAGLLGLAAFRLGAASPLGLPASPLLPLLAGLFALPGLVRGLRAARPPRPARLRPPRPPRGEVLRVAAPGALASCMVGLAPGVSASHVALALPRARTPERALLQVGAVGGGAVVFTLLAWHALGKARSGALVVADALAPRAPWTTWAPTPALLHEAALVLAAAGLACLLARLASRPLARLPTPRPLCAVGLAALVLSVALLNGVLGLAELAVAGLVGESPRRLGVRRSHAMGVILVPALLRAWGLA